MERGFGIDASTPLDIAVEVAALVEMAGYGSFWVNGSPHDAALDIVEGVCHRTDLDAGVGVFPLPEISADDLVAEIRRRALPQDRLWLGVGSGRPAGALNEVRQAARTFRTKLDVHVITGGVGPMMLMVGGEVADTVILTWSFRSEVERARLIIEDAAAAVQRATPKLASFIRCGLLPQASAAIAERAAVYDSIPHYRRVFARNGLSAAETVVTGHNREELLEGIAREEAVLDLPVIRAIPAEQTVASIGALVEACAP